MRANELKIGNLLYNDGVVVVIDARTIFDIWDDKGLKNYKPIPLTKEWLLKFGFNINMSNTAYWKDDLEFLIGIYDGIFYYGTWEYDMNENPYVFKIKEIKFVHKLQNLFFEIEDKELTYAED